MDRLGKVPKGRLSEELRSEYQQFMEQVMEAVNAAPDGRLIEGSEERVNDLMNQFKARVYQKALQARISVSETAAAKAPAAFSPSRRRTGASQRAAFDQPADACGSGGA